MTTQVRFGIPGEGLLTSSDEDFLAGVEWRGSRSSRLSAPDAGQGAMRTVGLCWKQQLARCTWPESEIPLEISSLNTAVQTADPDSLPGLLKQIRSSFRRRAGKGREEGISRRLIRDLDAWLNERATTCEDCPETLLACVELLVLYGAVLPATTLGRVWKTALSGAIAQSDAFHAAGEAADWEDIALDDGECGGRWLQAGLLPWACGLLFDDVKGAPRLLKAGRRQITDQLLLVTDEDGVPIAPVIESLSHHLARWKDAVLLSRIFSRALWKEGADRRLKRTLPVITATLGADGRLCGCLADDGTGPQLLAMVATLLGEKKNTKWVSCIRSVMKHGRAGRIPPAESASRVRRREIPSWQSDDAEAACLRTDWSPDASVATLTWHEDPVGLELVTSGIPLLVGPWGLTLQEDGDDVELDDAWECICWHSDRDVDYCELQLEFDDGSRLSRYLLLSRQRQFALLADIASGSTAGHMQLTTELSLADGVSAARRKGSREWRLKAGHDRIRLCPLAMPQDAGLGTVASADVREDDGQNELVFSAVSSTGGLCSPLLIDWSPRRRNQPCEWSPLTVSEVMNIDRDGSAAWRVRFGDQHLVVFRALRPTDRYRTVLGYQTEHETVIADFTSRGDFREILLVE